MVLLYDPAEGNSAQPTLKSAISEGCVDSAPVSRGFHVADSAQPNSESPYREVVQTYLRSGLSLAGLISTKQV